MWDGIWWVAVFWVGDLKDFRDSPESKVPFLPLFALEMSLGILALIWTWDLAWTRACLLGYKFKHILNILEYLARQRISHLSAWFAKLTTMGLLRGSVLSVSILLT